MMPTIFPSGPNGWTTFWTAAVSVRLPSSMTVTVIRSMAGDAIAVTIRTTDKMGNGNRCFFRPQGARRKRVSVTVRIRGIPPELEARGMSAANPLVPVPHRVSDDIIVPLGRGPPHLDSISIMRPETKHATNQTIEREALVLLDGDHQHNPKDIPRIVEPILAGKADVVLGVRWGKTSGMPLYRRIGKRALDYATATATKNGLLTDSQCGFRVFSSRALSLIEPTDNGLSIESQMLLEAQERNLRIQEVNIDARYDIEGSTLSPGRHGTTVLGRIVTLVSEKRPLFSSRATAAVLRLMAAGL